MLNMHVSQSVFAPRTAKQCVAAPHVRSSPSGHRSSTLLKAGKGGFGKTSQKRIDTDSGSYTRPGVSQRLAKELGMETPAEVTAAATAEFKNGWRNLGAVADLFSVKNVKAVEFGQKAVVLYNYKGQVYCSDALSTAFKYPLVDAKVFDGADGRGIIEVPLDGTQYDLETGKVVAWCPGNGPLRSVLGVMKKDTPAEDLKMYDIQVLDGKVFAWLYTKMT